MATALAAAPAQATTINASPGGEGTAGNGICSLREAITASNTNAVSGGGDCPAGSSSASDTIVLSAGTYDIETAGNSDDGNASGDFDITDEVVIQGAGSAQTTIDAHTLDRVFDVASGLTSVTINGVEITGGQTPAGSSGSPGQPGADGGGVRTQSPLTLDHVLVTGNGTGTGGGGSIGNGINAGAGGSGGGVAATSGELLTLVDSVVSGNTTGDGGTGGGPAACSTASSFGGQGGTGGDGGGIFGTNVVVTRTVVSSNTTGAGGAGGCGVTPGGAGSGGAGGGIAASQLTLTDATISENHTGLGGASGGDGDGANSVAGGKGGGGGGIAAGSTSTILRSTISANQTGAGGSAGLGTPTGSAATALGGRGGDGGAAFFHGGTVTITDSTIDGNSTGAGGGSAHGTPGPAGSGGGAFMDSTDAVVNVSGSTFSNNTAATTGGGIFLRAAGAPGINATFSNSTFTANSPAAVEIYKVVTQTFTHVTFASNSGPALKDDGSAISGRNVTLSNSILASNGSTNCLLEINRLVIDNGHNIVFGSNCQSVQPTGGDPLLGPLADNGGPTKTMAIGVGSSALDIVPATGADCTPYDQRGIARPYGSGCDAGAFEYYVPPPSPPETTPPTDNNPPPGGMGTTTPPPTGTDTSTQRDLPVIALQIPKQTLRKILKKGFVCTFTSSKPGAASLRFGKFASKKLTVKTAGKQTCRLKLSKKAKKKLAKLKRLTVTVKLTVVDANGASATTTKKLKLRR